MNTNTDSPAGSNWTAAEVELAASEARDRAAERRRHVKIVCRPGSPCQVLDADETAVSQQASRSAALAESPSHSVTDDSADVGLLTSSP